MPDPTPPKPDTPPPDPTDDVVDAEIVDGPIPADARDIREADIVDAELVDDDPAPLEADAPAPQPPSAAPPPAPATDAGFVPGAPSVGSGRAKPAAPPNAESPPPTPAAAPASPAPPPAPSSDGGFVPGAPSVGSGGSGPAPSVSQSYAPGQAPQVKMSGKPKGEHMRYVIWYVLGGIPTALIVGFLGAIAGTIFTLLNALGGDAAADGGSSAHPTFTATLVLAVLGGHTFGGVVALAGAWIHSRFKGCGGLIAGLLIYLIGIVGFGIVVISLLRR